MKLVGPEFYAETDPVIEINFGVIAIDTINNLTIQTKDINGNVIHSKTLNLQDLTFNKARLRHASMCIAY